MTEGTPAQRLRLALEMSEFGVQMYRTRMRRMYPNASSAEIADKVASWLLSRSGTSEASSRPSARFA
ncbi:hypothetical protein ACTWPB_15830 [Nocardia sp. IBHARD005]|uniref:hypothetical protein n=1 Tax=Nocardia sp. IBHARD005 TaxID=3457765 RepID=UPI004058B773